MKSSQRRNKRFTIEKLGVSAKSWFASDIEILDICAGGACIRTSRSLKAGGKYIIKIKKQGSPVTVRCRVVWENIGGTIRNAKGNFVQTYIAGVEFEDIFSDKLDNLMNFVRNYGFQDDEQRLYFEQRLSGLRFKVYSHDDVVLTYQKIYAVENISLGGMLVVARNAMRVGGRFSMRLYLPDQKLPVKLLGNVVSCIRKPGTASKRYNAGIEFVNMEKDDKVRLIRFITSLYRH